MGTLKGHPYPPAMLRYARRWQSQRSVGSTRACPLASAHIGAMLSAMRKTIIVIFLCLAALYESWSIPFAVILVVPLGLLGETTNATCSGLRPDSRR